MQVPVLEVRAVGETLGDDDGLRGLLFGYAMHPTCTRDGTVHGDWCGWAQHFVEEMHPGCTALFIQGESKFLICIMADRVMRESRKGLDYSMGLHLVGRMNSEHIHRCWFLLEFIQGFSSHLSPPNAHCLAH
jgi:hypothetical protein